METGTQMRLAAAEGTRAVLAAILVSAGLAAVKILAGLRGNSYALVADGLESLLDIFGSLIKDALIGSEVPIMDVLVHIEPAPIHHEGRETGDHEAREKPRREGHAGTRSRT